MQPHSSRPNAQRARASRLAELRIAALLLLLPLDDVGEAQHALLLAARLAVGACAQAHAGRGMLDKDASSQHMLDRACLARAHSRAQHSASRPHHRCRRGPPRRRCCPRALPPSSRGRHPPCRSTAVWQALQAHGSKGQPCRQLRAHLPVAAPSPSMLSSRTHVAGTSYCRARGRSPCCGRTARPPRSCGADGGAAKSSFTSKLNGWAQGRAMLSTQCMRAPLT